jgi:hypothetical protein
MKQTTNEAFSPEESKKIYDNFLSIVGTRRDKLVKRYGKEAEKVAYAKAVKQVKKQAEKNTMDKEIEESANEEVVMYNGEEHEVMRHVDDESGKRVYIRRKAPSTVLGKLNTFWVKPEDLEEGTCGYAPEGNIDVSNTDELSPAGPHLRLKEMVKDALTKKPVKEFETDEELIADEPISETSNNPYYNAIVTKAKEMGVPVRDYIKDLLKSKTDSDVAQMGYQDLAALAGIDGIDEDIDIGHTDDEPGMMKAELYRIRKYATELYKMVDKYDNMESEVDFPHWWQSKIIKSKEMMVAAKHYLDFEMKEPQLDDEAGAASEEEVIDEKFASKAQQRYLHATNPEAAEKLGSKMTKKDYKTLPDKVAEAVFAKLREDKGEYAKVEKQMFDLKKDGKRNTPGYEKLIKQRAELEKSKK